MLIYCNFNGRVVSKNVSTYHDKQYFNLGVISDAGNIGEFGCTPEVFNSIIVDKQYSLFFDINTAYLKKDCSCFIRISDFGEPILNSKKGGKS